LNLKGPFAAVCPHVIPVMQTMPMVKRMEFFI